MSDRRVPDRSNSLEDERVGPTYGPPPGRQSPKPLVRGSKVMLIGERRIPWDASINPRARLISRNSALQTDGRAFPHAGDAGFVDRTSNSNRTLYPENSSPYSRIPYPEDLNPSLTSQSLLSKAAGRPLVGSRSQEADGAQRRKIDESNDASAHAVTPVSTFHGQGGQNTQRPVEQSHVGRAQADTFGLAAGFVGPAPNQPRVCDRTTVSLSSGRLTA
jgi:hypothetical protein